MLVPSRCVGPQEHRTRICRRREASSKRRKSSESKMRDAGTEGVANRRETGRERERVEGWIRREEKRGEVEGEC